MVKSKIKVKTTITRCTKKKGCFGLGLGDVNLNEEKRNKIGDLIDTSEEVNLTIEPVDEHLPGM
jgi:hypothetical protein